MSYYSREKKFTNYFLPFLIFIAFGLIAVLSIQVFDLFNNSKNDQFLLLNSVDGKVDITPWNYQESEKGIAGSRILQGDKIFTSNASKAELVVFENTAIRMDANTEIEIEQLKSPEKTLEINLKKGRLWVKNQNSAKDKEITIDGNFFLIKSLDSVFSIELNYEEKIHNISGKSELAIRSANSEFISTISKHILESGEQAIITSQAISEINANRTPDLITTITEDFFNSPWFLENSKKDSSNTQIQESLIREIKPATEQVNAAPKKTQTPSKKAPKVTTPADSPYTLESNSFTLRGEAPPNAKSIIVTTIDKTRESPYTLQSFKLGDTTWNYNVSTRLGNLQTGENKFQIYAVFEDEEKSPATEISIIYIPKNNSATPDSLQ
jgi:hypothetical protein